MTAPSGELVDLRGTPQRTKIPGSMISNLTNVEAAYAKELQNYNDHVLKGITRPSLFNAFSKATESFHDKKVLDMWQMIKSMIDIPPIPSGDQIKSRNNPTVERKIVLQARNYLENRYKDFMNSLVSENLAQAMRGGIPGTLPLVKSFVGIKVQNMKYLEEVIVEDRPLWPLVYYCLRAGDLKAALHCLNQCGTAFQEFRSALEEASQDPDHRPSSKSESSLKLLYKKNIRSATDPYKKAAYCALVPCDPDDLHTEVMSAAEDYLWLKLCQIREQADQENKLTLDHLQTTILEVYGINTFYFNEI